MRCSVKVGFFLARACDEPANLFCNLCQNPVCAGHSRPLDGAPGRVCCLQCEDVDPAALGKDEAVGLPPTQRWIPASDVGGTRGKNYSQRSPDETLVLGADDLSSDQFSSEDIASFDEISEADKRLNKSDVYDS